MAIPKIPKKKTLTAKQKIKVLAGALKLLGPNGEHWTRHKYFGKRVRPGASRQTYRENADCWCLVGALKESALRLGHKDDDWGIVWRIDDHVSILNLVKQNTKFDTTEGFNDAPGRTFPEVKDLIEKRISELKANVPA